MELDSAPPEHETTQVGTSRLRRICVVGSSGAGKTTLARQLAERLEIAHVELDALYWEPNWMEAPVERFRERVTAAVAGEAWVADGNYSKVRDLVWGRAGTLVWLDYSLPLVMRRLTARTLRRGLRREELWSGNRERLWNQLKPRDSILWFALTTYRRRRRQFTQTLAQPEYAHLRLLRFGTPRQTDAWLHSVPAARPEEAGDFTEPPTRKRHGSLQK